jgi:hypothetical protein
LVALLLAALLAACGSAPNSAAPAAQAPAAAAALARATEAPKPTEAAPTTAFSGPGPLSVGMTYFNGQFSQMPHLIQATALMALPLLLFLCAQRFFMQGVVITGVDR